MNQSLTVDLADTLHAVESTGLFISRASINAPSQSRDALGQVNLTTFTPVAGLQNLPCMMAPLVDAKPNPYFEIKNSTEIAQMGEFHVLIDGYYPQIKQYDQAVVDGSAYDILTVESDSQHIMTRLAVRRLDL